MKDNMPHLLVLPQDLGIPMPPQAQQWLEKYLTVEEIETFCFWSATYNRICFPYYIRPEGKDSSEMIMCWMRTLAQPTKTKWLFTGDNTIWPFIIRCDSHKLHNPNRVCLVEDVISGVKVSKYINTIVLGSTVISTESPIWAKLSKFDEVVLFLDGDSAGKKGAEKLRNQLKLLYNVRVIRNTKDPKNYTDAELMDFIYD
jgi:5S rRNA maturation endonuclease (ribonuclease M5)